jgi:hypothetical protein
MMLADGQGQNTVHKLPDNESNLQIPSALAIMKRFCEITDATTDESTDESDDESSSDESIDETSDDEPSEDETRDDETNDDEPINEISDEYTITFATGRIAKIVTDVQRKENWTHNWETLKMYFRGSETRVAAGHLFQRMFLPKFRSQDPSAMPSCYELGETTGAHPLSPLGKQAKAAMPWKGIGQQPNLAMISVGKDINGSSLYSKEELRMAINGVMDENSPPIRFLIPLAQNWASWDAALLLRSGTKKKRELHIVFLQTTLQEGHDIVAKGLNQVKTAVPKRFRVHYHYVLVLLIYDEPTSQIPKWRHVLLDSKGRKKDKLWNRDNLKQYIMYVPMKELLKRSSKV